MVSRYNSQLIGKLARNPEAQELEKKRKVLWRTMSLVIDDVVTIK